MQKIKNFFDSGIPVLLEGPTGTSKTKTIQVLCEILNKKLIRFNLSAETTIEDLIGRLGSSNEDSWNSFTFIPGPFTEAFEKGYVLLLDEVNLGQKSVLQCMESALDTGEIIQDIPGCGTIKKVMNKILFWWQHKILKLKDLPIKEKNYPKNFCPDSQW